MSGTIQSITLQPKPSRLLQAWRVAIHLLALLTTLFAPMMLWPKVSLLTALALYGYFSFRQGGKGGDGQIGKVTITPYGRARIVMQDGRNLRARIRRDSLVIPWLVVLRFDLDKGWPPCSLVLAPDAVSEEQMRQLRVLLRFGEIRQNDRIIKR
ncbi:MAG: protein YgfX [Candidatus Thiodiazotropha endolucinida]